LSATQASALRSSVCIGKTIGIRSSRGSRSLADETRFNSLARRRFPLTTFSSSRKTDHRLHRKLTCRHLGSLKNNFSEIS
jgi:hypothetical protein